MPFLEEPCQYQLAFYQVPSLVVNRNQLQAVFLDISMCSNIGFFFLFCLNINNV